MALLFIEGFDHYQTADISKKWTALGASGSVIGGVGRRGGGVLAMFSTGDGPTRSVPAVATLIAGAAFKHAGGMPGSNASVFYFGYSNSTQVTVAVAGDGSIKAFRGNTAGVLLGTSASGVISSDVYNYIEAKVYIHASAGTVEVRVNGVTVLNLTGQNTFNTGSALVSYLGLGYNSTSKYLYVDDLYICNTSGSTNNDFLGDCRVDTLLPTADGSYTDLTPNSGSAHWSRVAEGAADTTSYVTSGTVAAKDTYQLGDLAPVTGTIKGVQVVNAALKDDAGSRSIANLIRSGATDATGPTVALSTSQLMYASVHELDPATGAAWTESAVNALQAGVKVAA